MKSFLPLILWCFSLGIVFQATAQISPYESHLAIYRDAEELYEKKLYAAAQRKLGEFLENEKNLRGEDFNDLHVNARYMQAVSQYHLEQSDAALSLTQFAEEFPENTKAMMAYYYLGNHYFDNGRYAEAIDPFFMCYSSSSIAKDKNAEVIFKLGYCYFHEENNPRADRIQANRFLELAANVNGSPYQEDAQYYRAILLYNNQDYARAYEALKALDNSSKYGGEMKVYLAHTLLKLRRYDELYQLANNLSLNPEEARKNAEVFAIVANASYEENDFANAVQYFDRYAATRRPMTRVSNFRYAYSLYQLQKYREAIPVYQKVLRPADSLAQVASYYLGFSYLKNGDPESAKFAFNQAANSNQIDNDPEFAMDALYQYGKVCFETQDYDEAYGAFSKLVDGVSYPRFNKVNEVKQLIGELFVYSKNYEEAIQYFESTSLQNPAAKRAYQSACYYYGLELYKQKNYNLTTTYFSKAQRVNADRDISLSSMYWDAESRFRAENYASARNAYSAYLNANGARNNLFYQYGNYGIAWAYFKEKNYNQAYTYFTRFADGRTAQTPKRPVVDAYLRAGDSKFLLKQYQQADALYRKVAQANLGFQDFAFYQWGESLYRQRSYERSVSTFGQIVEKYKKSELRDNALDRISEIYGNWIKDFNRSAYYANILVNDYPRSPLAADAYNRLAYAAYNTGKQSQAVNYYKKVLSDFPTDKKNSQAALDNLATL
ncbi:MAG: tetratricopeptide repeat protein, partial [Bacteroidota bacterium]